MNERKRLTNKIVDSVRAPQNGKDEYRDTDCRGLFLRVYPTGMKAWYLEKWIPEQKKKKFFKLGEYPTINCADARKLAQSVAKQEIMSTEEENIAKMSFKEAYELYKEKHLLLNARPKTILNYDQLVDGYLSKIYDCPIANIPKGKVEGIFHEVEAYAPVAALRVMEVVRAVCNYWHKRCPAVKDATVWVDRAAAKRRKKEAEEAKEKPWLKFPQCKFFIENGLAIYGATKNLPTLAILTALMTGARASNVYSMEWGEINFDNASWTIPASKYKARHNQTIFLSEPIASILRELKDHRSSDQYVFHSPNAKCGHIINVRKALNNIQESCGFEIKGLNMHAMRRTFISHAALCNLPVSVTMKLAGHSQINSITFDVYAQVDDGEVRDGFTQTVSRMLGIGVEEEDELANSKEEAA